ncbi:MAG: fasciclin domain-containing protein [Paraprevotella sp.]|nr:fasciclin domain-containing protein [Paraprevotella sp.]
MKYLSQLSKIVCGIMLMTGTANLVTSCQDDIPAGSYYTFTGEMMSDYLNNHEDFSLFKRIVERAGEMDYLGSRGSRTFLPATNAGVEAFLKEKGYASVEDIPASYCDTLVKSCVIDRMMFTYDLPETQQDNNGLNLPLIFETTGDTVDANNIALTVVNRRAAIINELKDDSVENGVVHPVDHVLIPNTSLGSTLLDQNYKEFQIYYEALRRTGLIDSLYRYRDDDYEEWKDNYSEYSQSMLIGNEWYVGKRPDHRYEGFTLLIVPDNVLYEKYGDRFKESMTMDEKIDALYDLAAEKYDDNTAASIFGLDKISPTEGKTYKELYWNKSSLTSRYNPLNMFLSYHIIDRLFSSTAKLINTYCINTSYADPTEWISTMLDYSTIKLEKVYQPVDAAVEYPSDFYVNHTQASQYNDGQRIRGAHLTTPKEDNFSLNVAYYYLDDVVAYDDDMRNNVMNTRMRIEFHTLWPELTNNNIRLCGNPLQPYDAAGDNSEEGTEGGGYNYYLPPGYLKNVTFSDNTIFFIERPMVYWSSHQGDYNAILGTSYDVTFRLPNVPPGSYELRLGYCALADRGIGQVYVDGVPQGLPLDMRDKADSPKIGGIYNGWNGVRCKDDASSGVFTKEELEDNARIMKNNGYYSGPKSTFYFSGTTPVTSAAYDPSRCIIDYNQNDLLRRKISQVDVQANQHHSIRIRSVMSNATSGCFSLDYMELVPISICGPGGIGEDLY